MEINSISSLVSQATGGTPSAGTNSAAGASGNSNSGQVFDPKDTNQDGFVSVEEELAYAMKHPNEEEPDSATTVPPAENGNSLDVTA